MKYVQVTGISGSGKSTLAKKIAAKYNLRYIEMDAVFWKKDWQTPTDEEFIAKVEKILNEAREGWVVDGTYGSILGDTLTSRIDTIVALDVGPWTAIPRVIKRSVGRMVRKDLLWGKCKETPLGLIKLCHWILKTQKRRLGRIDELQKNSKITVLKFKNNAKADEWLVSL